MKRTQRQVVIALLTISMLSVTAFETNVKADILIDSTITANSIKRIVGVNSYATSNLIADNFNKAETVIIATGENYPDALTVAPVAKIYNAPVLLSNGAELSKDTLTEITRLGAKKAILAGGVGVLSDSVYKQLDSIGLTIVRLDGDDRYETSLLSAKLIPNPKSIALVYGENYTDILSISPITASKGIPVLLVGKDGLSADAIEYIQSLKLDSTYIIGDISQIPSYTMSYVSNPIKIGGDSIYSTELAILTQFKSDISFDSIYLASASDYANTLSVPPLALKTNSPIILTNPLELAKLAQLLSDSVLDTTKVIAIGESDSLPQEVLDTVTKIIATNGKVNSSIKEATTKKVTPIVSTTTGGSSNSSDNYSTPSSGGSTGGTITTPVDTTTGGSIATPTTPVNTTTGGSITTPTTPVNTTTGGSITTPVNTTTGGSITTPTTPGGTQTSTVNKAQLNLAYSSAISSLGVAFPYLSNVYVQSYVTSPYNILLSDSIVARDTLNSSTTSSQITIDTLTARLITEISNLNTAVSTGVNAIPVSSTVSRVNTTVSGIDTLSPITVAYGTALSIIALPKVTLETTTITTPVTTTTASGITTTTMGTSVTTTSALTLDVIWDNGVTAGNVFNPSIAGVYKLTGHFNLPNDISLGILSNTDLTLSVTILSNSIVAPIGISSLSSISDKHTAVGTTLTDLSLPNTVTGQTIGGAITLGVTWDTSLVNFSTPGTYSVVGSVTTPTGYSNSLNLTETLNVIVDTPVVLSNTKSITSFTVPSMIGVSSIDSSAHTINFSVPNSVDITTLIPTIVTDSVTSSAITVGGVLQVSGVTSQNFTFPIVYKVKAEDGSTHDWTATCTVVGPVLDNLNTHLLSTSADDIIYVECDTFNVSDIKGIKLRAVDSYSLPTDFTINGNSIFIFNLPNDGYVYVKLQDDTEWFVALK